MKLSLLLSLSLLILVSLLLLIQSNSYNNNHIVFVTGFTTSSSSFVHEVSFRLRHNSINKNIIGRKSKSFLYVTSSSDNTNVASTTKSHASPKKTMEFLKRIGKIGNNVNNNPSFDQSTTSTTTIPNNMNNYIQNAIGVDEGNAGSCTLSSTPTKTTAIPPIALRNQQQHVKPVDVVEDTSTMSFYSCIETGIIDDMSNTFPYTSTGTQWGMFSDQVMGGISTGQISRERIHNRMANVLRGTVSLANRGGFIQMATNFATLLTTNDDTGSTATNAPALKNSFRTAIPIDASKYTGIELDVNCDVSEDFNVHLKTIDCIQPQISYRATFHTNPNTPWNTIRIPFTQIQGYNINIPLDKTKLTRIGIVAIGREMHNVQLAVSNIRFY